jgi:serine/threonine protein kinase
VRRTEDAPAHTLPLLTLTLTHLSPTHPRSLGRGSRGEAFLVRRIRTAEGVPLPRPYLCAVKYAQSTDNFAVVRAYQREKEALDVLRGGCPHIVEAVDYLVYDLDGPLYDEDGDGEGEEGAAGDASSFDAGGGGGAGGGGEEDASMASSGSGAAAAASSSSSLPSAYLMPLRQAHYLILKFAEGKDVAQWMVKAALGWFGARSEGDDLRLLPKLKPHLARGYIQVRLDGLLGRNVARQSLEALAHAHSRRVLHRDIKADNLFVKYDVDKSCLDLKEERGSGGGGGGAGAPTAEGGTAAASAAAAAAAAPGAAAGGKGVFRILFRPTRHHAPGDGGFIRKRERAEEECDDERLQPFILLGDFSDGRTMLTDMASGGGGMSLKTEEAGKAECRAPEVATGVYSYPADVFSLGLCFLHIIYEGLRVAIPSAIPSFHAELTDLFSEIVTAGFPPRDRWTSVLPGIDPLFADLLSNMLARDPKSRATAAELVSHPWITGIRAMPALRVGEGAGAAASASSTSSSLSASSSSVGDRWAEARGLLTGRSGEETSRSTGTGSTTAASDYLTARSGSIDEGVAPPTPMADDAMVWGTPRTSSAGSAGATAAAASASSAEATLAGSAASVAAAATSTASAASAAAPASTEPRFEDRYEMIPNSRVGKSFSLVFKARRKLRWGMTGQDGSPAQPRASIALAAANARPPPPSSSAGAGREGRLSLGLPTGASSSSSSSSSFASVVVAAAQAAVSTATASSSSLATRTGSGPATVSNPFPAFARSLVVKWYKLDQVSEEWETPVVPLAELRARGLNLHHAHVATVLDYYEQPFEGSRSLLCVMEDAVGGPLLPSLVQWAQKVLDADPSLEAARRAGKQPEVAAFYATPRLAATLVRQMLLAAEYLHAQGRVQGDLRMYALLLNRAAVLAGGVDFPTPTAKKWLRACVKLDLIEPGTPVNVSGSGAGLVTMRAPAPAPAPAPATAPADLDGVAEPLPKRTATDSSMSSTTSTGSTHAPPLSKATGASLSVGAGSRGGGGGSGSGSGSGSGTSSAGASRHLHGALGRALTSAGFATLGTSAAAAGPAVAAAARLPHIKVNPVNPVRTSEALEFELRLTPEERMSPAVDLWAIGHLLEKLLGGMGVEPATATRVEQSRLRVPVPCPKPAEDAMDLVRRLKGTLRPVVAAAGAVATDGTAAAAAPFTATDALADQWLLANADVA